MLGSERRVAITGLGLVTPLGRQSGHRLDVRWPKAGGWCARSRRFGSPACPTTSAPKSATSISRNTRYPSTGTHCARPRSTWPATSSLRSRRRSWRWPTPGLVDGGVDPTRIGIDLGAGLISSELDELAPAIGQAYAAGKSFDFQVWGRESIEMIEPIWLLKYLPNMLACHISILIDCQGPSNTITEADASSNLAIAEAARIIARGRADVMITGGADSKIHPLEPGPDGACSRPCRAGKASPAEACRPFDRRRDGWVPGEGAGILILEEWEHALKRGSADPWARS